mmetsp:Transcript_21377/g.44068  ORF Transcript_21377/g.44068 Transcript_21377/m.44068 type:complete len:633 (-) Transcript_21377:50-1948(-)
MVRKAVMHENASIYQELARLRAQCHELFGRGPSPQQEANQSWSEYLGLTATEPAPKPAPLKPPGMGMEDFEDSEDDMGHVPGSEPVRQIHHGEFQAAPFLGLEVIDFQHSIWDAALIVMLHSRDRARQVVGNFNAFLATTLLLMNIAIQVGLILAVNSLAEPNPLGTLKSVLREQRIREGQAYHNFDRKDLITQTQQVCNQKLYNEMADTTHWLAEYTNRGGVFGKLSGDVICMLAMFVWVTSMATELRRTVHDMGLVVVSLPRTEEMKYELRQGRYIITGVKTVQKAFSVMMVILPRTLIAVFLLWYGLIYLAGTINIDDLLLNAVALEFVKNIDELLFEALVPRRMAAMVSNMAIQIYVSRHHTLLPNELREGRLDFTGLLPPETKRGLSLSLQSFYALFRVFYIAGILVGGWVFYLAPVAEDAREALDAVCGHDVTFTYMLHPVTNIPVFAHVDPLEPGRHDKEELRCFYAAQFEMVKLRAGFQSEYLGANSTLAAMIGGFHPACKPENIWAAADVACPETSLQYFERAKMTGPADFFKNKNQDCRDQDVFFAVLRALCIHPKFTVYTAGELDFFQDTHQCSDLQMQCHKSRNHEISLPWFWQLQKTCPETCGMCEKGAPGGALASIGE